MTSGLTVEEIERIEAGHRFDKGYRVRLARHLGMPEGAFDAAAEIQNAA